MKLFVVRGKILTSHLEVLDLKLLFCILVLGISYSPVCISSGVSGVELANNRLHNLAEDLGLNRVTSDAEESSLKVRVIESIFSIETGTESLRKLYLFDNKRFDELLTFAESNKQIKALRDKIRQYEQLSNYQWPQLEASVFSLGQRATDIAKLRWVLVKLDDLEFKDISAYREAIFDPSITRSLKRFQKRHGLIQSGELNKETITLLNTEPAFIVSKLQLSLKDKLSKVNYQSSSYIEVNIPEFKLRIKGDKSSTLEFPVIVGSIKNKTPLLHTYVSKITINPTWTPPRSIVYNELLTELKKSPKSLENQKFVLVKKGNTNEVKSLKGMDASRLKQELKVYQLVQSPGFRNALGKYRFTIPNSELIFMHDTPDKQAFKKRNRAISHGCIRLSQPELLAKYLIDREGSIDSSRFLSARQGVNTVDIKLRNPIPIIITNQNVWVDKDNVLQVRPNIYNREVTE